MDRYWKGGKGGQGSHDSFSFYIDEASPVGPEQPETVQNFVSVFGTVAKKLMRKWLATQTMNFTSQLGAGIRYFDLRISTKPRDPDNELYFAHGLFSAKVKEGLEEINAFLIEHPKEVVFLDFNHFYGMQKCHHEKLVQMLKDTYGNKMCPAIFAHEVSLQYLWEKEHQVLVFYHSPVAVEVAFLWPGQMMPAPWANTTDTEKLIQFLQASITERRKKGSFFISQVVLTPKASTVVKGVASGLRETITERLCSLERYSSLLLQAIIFMASSGLSPAQVQFHPSGAEGQNPLFPSPSHTALNAAQVVFLGCKTTCKTLLGHVEFLIHQHPQVYPCWIALNPISPQPVQNLTHVQNLAFDLELYEVCTDLPLKSVKMTGSINPSVSTRDVEKLIDFRCWFVGQGCSGLSASDLANSNPGQRDCSRMKAVPQEARALPAMMEWVRTQKAGESGVNIITADFVELGDFISTVIKLNYSLDEGEDDTT
ncbi:PI-PLC X domain-containing protein 3 [Lonchura striata]|uniref:PI-PLC X domain-containing protein 3 n=1 Tax=Lonchura striata TaxID=40157 RepID=A0A218UVT0_9PASE|nr:PI-PLC X domain-containing protein 3 [Lonchura striata domestica]